MIRPAGINDNEILTEISFDSKGFWQYPAHYFDIWKKELTITPDYIRENSVHVLEHGRKVVGYYSIVCLEEDLDVSGLTLRGIGSIICSYYPGIWGRDSELSCSIISKRGCGSQG